MKKVLLIFISSLLAFHAVNAKQVAQEDAKKVAINFIAQNCKIANANLPLAYVEKSFSGEEDYFVFNINSSGFIIISAEDAGMPVIGYSTETTYEIPSATSNLNFIYWMNGRKQEIEFIRANNLQPTDEIKSQWNIYTNNLKNNSAQVNSVAPLCKTLWNQGSYYNAQCPGNSLTGCIATAMAQIMKYWNYPSQGIGSSSYNSSYGMLSANYGATTYNWSAMPNSVTSANSAVATLMYHCGVSVDMAYSPSSSGAQMIILDSPVCAEASYKQYFGYDSTTLHGYYRSSFTDVVWTQMLENDLNNGMPIQYAGMDASASSGHSWVLDGYDVSNNMHMNWGWSGSYNGYFSINALNPANMNFSYYNQAIMGIQPQGAATGIHSLTNEESINVYPNPSNGVFQITSSEKNSSLEIYNTMGEKIYSSFFNINKEEINLSNQPKGIYFLETISGKERRTKKIILE